MLLANNCLNCYVVAAQLGGHAWGRPRRRRCTAGEARMRGGGAAGEALARGGGATRGARRGDSLFPSIVSDKGKMVTS